jgi:hypothetical protein
VSWICLADPCGTPGPLKGVGGRRLRLARVESHQSHAASHRASFRWRLGIEHVAVGHRLQSFSIIATPTNAVLGGTSR